MQESAQNVDVAPITETEAPGVLKGAKKELDAFGDQLSAAWNDPAVRKGAKAGAGFGIVFLLILWVGKMLGITS